MMLHNHRPGFAIAVMGLAAVWLAAPAPASADQRDWRAPAEDSRRDDHFRDGQSHLQHREQARRGHDEGRRYGDRDPAPVAHGFPLFRPAQPHHLRPAALHQHRALFYCELCRHRFTSRDSFHRHLLRDHHVPPQRLSRLIVPSALGFFFFGSR